MKILHNPRCSKSREALALLEGDDTLTIVEYLKNPPSIEELKDILSKLKMRPKDIVRHKEEIFSQLKLNLDDDSAVLKALLEYPVLIERPIVIKGDQAVIGRPLENVQKLLAGS